MATEQGREVPNDSSDHTGTALWMPVPLIHGVAMLPVAVGALHNRVLLLQK
jgi:hypothetical protein